MFIEMDTHCFIIDCGKPAVDIKLTFSELDIGVGFRFTFGPPPPEIPLGEYTNPPQK